MQYGYFDLEHKEYVITRPDTPAPWANYLGSPEYGAIVSNNGGGYSFVKSGANGSLSISIRQSATMVQLIQLSSLTMQISTLSLHIMFL